VLFVTWLVVRDDNQFPRHEQDDKKAAPVIPVIANDGYVFAPIPGTGRWNLVPNGDFEEAAPKNWPPGWPPQVDPDNRGLGIFVRSTKHAFLGQASVQATPAKAFNNQGFAHITEYMAVVPQHRYVLSAFFHNEKISSGDLSLDLADVDFNVRVMAQPKTSGWHFAWKSFVPKTESVRVRLIRDGTVKSVELGYIDGVAVTPAADFVPPSSVGKQR
jgi:hypothetical protein